jgi:hypothetical protein
MTPRVGVRSPQPGRESGLEEHGGRLSRNKSRKLQSHGYGRPIDEITFSNAIASNRFSGFAVTT